MTGLFGEPVKRKGVVADKVGKEKYQLWIEYFSQMFLIFIFLRQMVEMIFQFADFALKKCQEGKFQGMEQHFHVSHRTNPERLWVQTRENKEKSLTRRCK